MSLEAKIEALTAAVVALTAKLEATPVPAVPPTPAAPTPSAPAPAPVESAAPAPVAASPSKMPEPPTFQAPAAPAAGAPFTDGKGLIDYVMSSYKTLGPQKGVQMQGVLTGLGYQNINDVKPEHYAALYAGIEALKA
jgi:hypothetical protein